MSHELVVRVVLTVVLVGCGVLLMAVARATASGRLGRNIIAGIRVASTLASDEAWLAAHRRAQRPTVAGGGVALATGALLLFPFSVPAAVTIALVGIHVMLAFVVYGAVRGTATARAVGRHDE